MKPRFKQTRLIAPCDQQSDNGQPKRKRERERNVYIFYRGQFNYKFLQFFSSRKLENNKNLVFTHSFFTFFPTLCQV